MLEKRNRNFISVFAKNANFNYGDKYIYLKFDDQFIQ